MTNEPRKLEPINEEHALACFNLGIGLLHAKFRCKRPGCLFTFEIDSETRPTDIARYLKPKSEFCCSLCGGNPILEKKLYLEDET